LRGTTVRNDNRRAWKRQILELNTEVTNIMVGRQASEEENAAKSIEGNPRMFFKYAKKHKELRSKIGPLRKGDDTGYERGPRKMAEILSRQYESAFSEPKTDFTDLILPDREIVEIDDVEITEEAVRDALKSMVGTSSPGPDGIPAYLYKEHEDELIKPLMIILRNSLDSGKLPEGEALAVITPIHKGGEAFLAVNYRPVALTNHLTKIMERVIRKAVIAHLEKNGLMNPTQHGFRTGRSTISQLLMYYDDILFKND
jgi:hypothetical protein